ncbi:signal recognition particle subunit [Haplosporangium bisporale]|nr:signal recognition particle subunit [Haplosporangium bisporale]
MSKKSSSLNVLRKSNKESFFLPESDEEDHDVIQNNDDDDFDIDNMDFPLPTDDAIVPSAETPLTPEQRAQIEALMGHGAVGGKGNVGADGVRYVSGDELEQFKSWMQVYPCYIDGTKTVAEGRRIPKELACKKQPWAKDIVEALKELQLSQAFEPGKTHPRDWANRGRMQRDVSRLLLHRVGYMTITHPTKKNVNPTPSMNSLSSIAGFATDGPFSNANSASPFSGQSTT